MTENTTDARSTTPAVDPRRGRWQRPSRRFAVALLTALAVLVPAGAEASAATRVTRDVVVYGGTPAGVAAAVAAAGNGARVTLLA